jgi:uroporphyrinogen decarboxylase
MSERFLRAARRESTDATPVWFMRQAGRALPEFRAVRERASVAQIASSPALCAEVTLQPVHRYGVDAAILFADITTPLAGLGVSVEIVSGTGPVVAQPIRTRAQVEALRPFDPAAATGPLLEAIAILARESPVPVIGFAGAPFTLACYLVEGGPSREFVVTKRLMHAEPGTFAAVLDRLTTMTAAYLAAQVAAGAQALQLFDSWVGGLGPYDYERQVEPHMRRLFSALEPLGVPTIHFGTATAGLLTRMARVGGDVIGLDWRVSLGEAWGLFPERGVQGNLDPTLLLGPFEAVEEQARWILEQADGRPGHIFNLGHGVPAEADPDQVRRLVDLVHEVSSRRLSGVTG